MSLHNDTQARFPPKWKIMGGHDDLEGEHVSGYSLIIQVSFA